MTDETRNSNVQLLLRIKNGDSAALSQLVEDNLGLVRKVALHFVSRGVELEDLLQIGAIGMIKAARSFDFSFDTAFSTYAVPMITGEIRRFLRDDGPIKVSRGIKATGTKIMGEREKFIQEKGREPKLSELSQLLGISEQETVFAMESLSSVYSLSEPVNDSEALTLEGSIPDRENEPDVLTDRIALSEAIRKLPPLWREIIVLRYYNDLSQSETGKRLGLTQVKISREEQKLLSSLRAALA